MVALGKILFGDVCCCDCKYLMRIGAVTYACELRSDRDRKVFAEVLPMGKACERFVPKEWVLLSAEERGGEDAVK